MDNLTPRQRGVIKAAETNRRKKEDRLAAELRERGWTPLPPESRLNGLETQLDYLIERVEHLCEEKSSDRCGPCVAGDIRTHLRNIGALPQHVEHECCVCS